MDNLTKCLFGSFPRELMENYRVEVDSMDRMEDMVRSGYRHTSVYDLNLTIDKLPFDIDSPSIEASFDSARELIDKIEEENLSYIPVFSGFRGFHIYVPLKGFQPPNKETANYLLETGLRYFANGIDYIDEQKIGNVRQMMRIPNTSREDSECYCTYLPEEFVNWKPLDIINWSKSKHEIDVSLNGTEKDIRDFGDLSVEKSEFDLTPPDIEDHKLPKGDIKEFLSNIVRPCLIPKVTGNPGHKLRTELVNELNAVGYGPERILAIVEELGWSNYDRNTSWYHVQRLCKGGGLKPMACDRLKRFIDCNNCDFGYPWRS